MTQGKTQDCAAATLFSTPHLKAWFLVSLKEKARFGGTWDATSWWLYMYIMIETRFLDLRSWWYVMEFWVIIWLKFVNYILNTSTYALWNSLVFCHWSHLSVNFSSRYSWSSSCRSLLSIWVLCFPLPLSVLLQQRRRVFKLSESHLFCSRVQWHTCWLALLFLQSRHRLSIIANLHLTAGKLEPILVRLLKAPCVMQSSYLLGKRLRRQICSRIIWLFRF
jgi:hypothetical protein